MKIKQQTIGIGRPLVCVPLVELDENNIYKAAESAVASGAQALEWRMDWFAQPGCWNRMREVLHNLQQICGEVILLCTFRSKPQGGEREISQEEYLRLLLNISGSGQADLLDVEVSEIAEPSEVIRQLHSLGQCVVGSRHYFTCTPETEKLQEDLTAMQHWGADIGKLAVMPHSPMDVLALLAATAKMKEIYPQYPLITMAMGGLGVISRVSGEIFGSCMTFASMGKTSAPGQLPLQDARVILDKISESME